MAIADATAARTRIGIEATLAWLLWAAMFAAAIWLVLSYGFPLPYADEMELVPYALGEQPVTLGWLWSQHNEHRIFLPRLLYLGLTRLTGGDLRWAALYNTAALAGASALLMLAARRLRGQSRLYDAFFPFALLHWSHAINLLWIFQSAFITTAALACVLAWAVARVGPELNLHTALLASTCLILMSLCGANGIAYVPAMSGWLALAAIGRWQQGGVHHRRDAMLIFLLALLPVAMVGCYFLNFTPSPTSAGPKPGLLLRLETAVEMLSTCLGSAAREIWPFSGIIVLAGLVWSMACLARSWRSRSNERLRTAGLLCLSCGQLALALGIGWGRAELGAEAGLTSRYILLATPLVCLWYLQAVMSAAHAPAGTGGGLRRLAPQALFMIMCALLAVNTHKGLRDAIDMDARFVALSADIRQGLPPPGLARRHPFLYPSESVLAVRLEALRRARFGIFGEVGEDGPLHSSQVVTLAGALPYGISTGQVRIAPGESLTRRFNAPAGQVVSRIDLPINRWRAGRMLPTLHWTLSGREDGNLVLLRQGEADLTRLENVGSITLDLAAAPLDWRGELELTIHAPAADAMRRYMEFPTFASQPGAPAELNAFLFVQPAGNLAQAADSPRR